ncbi:sulfotransferase domain-containing protein [Loktanella sp. DJP18]|uniref:sulfotransferase domain-containing protein n=1 Tax=Loktanella sp. DJP18 TaxID=3409788 RepID=UPI003BB784DD
MRHPNTFIIGAPKCGTTTLCEWLEMHPAAAVSAIKEPNYFNTDMADAKSWQQRDYLDMFSHALEVHKVLAEGTTSYLYSEAAPGKILDMSPDARFVICLRNPSTMIRSLHRQRIFDGYETEQDFETCWDHQASREVSWRSGEKTPFLEMCRYRDACSLSTHIGRWIAAVPEWRIHFVVLDDLIENPERSWFDLCDFCGIDRLGLHEYASKNVVAVRRFPALSRALKGVLRLRKSLGVEVPGKSLGIPQALRRVIHRIDLMNAREGSKSPVSSDVASAVNNFFIPEVEKLEVILSRDLSHWKVSS